MCCTYLVTSDYTIRMNLTANKRKIQITSQYIPTEPARLLKEEV